jgi:hypothetical protein
VLSKCWFTGASAVVRMLEDPATLTILNSSGSHADPAMTGLLAAVQKLHSGIDTVSQETFCSYLCCPTHLL